MTTGLSRGVIASMEVFSIRSVLLSYEKGRVLCGKLVVSFFQPLQYVSLNVLSRAVFAALARGSGKCRLRAATIYIRVCADDYVSAL